MSLFGKMRPVSFNVCFDDPDGFCGVLTANAFWSQDGATCSIGIGLKEIPLSLAEMEAFAEALRAAINARREYDADFAAEDQP